MLEKIHHLQSCQKIPVQSFMVSFTFSIPKRKHRRGERREKRKKKFSLSRNRTGKRNWLDGLTAGPVQRGQPHTPNHRSQFLKVWFTILNIFWNKSTTQKHAQSISFSLSSSLSPSAILNTASYSRSMNHYTALSRISTQSPHAAVSTVLLRVAVNALQWVSKVH